MLKPSPSTSHNPTSGTGNVATNNQDTTNTAPPAAPTAKVNVEVFYVHPDHLGTPRVITASTALAATTGTGITSAQTVNKAVWRWDGDPFGSNATANSAPNENPNTLSQVVGTSTLPYLFGFDLAFPGQKRDRESGKHYNYFRDYDPGVGRYFESDPIGLRGGLSTFGYVSQSPSFAIDPDGLAGCYYAIGGGLYCKPNAGGPVLGITPPGVFSGDRKCKNNPDCVNTKYEGPIPPGCYNMTPHESKPGFWRLVPIGWTDKDAKWCRLGKSRCDFQLHPGQRRPLSR